jgi:hypothetical protein
MSTSDQRLSHPETASEGHDVKDLERLSGRRSEERPRLIGVQGCNLLLPHLRRVNSGGRVERYQVEPHGLLQSTMQDGVYVADARRLEAVPKLARVEGLNVSRQLLFRE